VATADLPCDQESLLSDKFNLSDENRGLLDAGDSFPTGGESFLLSEKVFPVVKKTCYVTAKVGIELKMGVSAVLKARDATQNVGSLVWRPYVIDKQACTVTSYSATPPVRVRS
jgi:hypothetical protein